MFWSEESRYLTGVADDRSGSRDSLNLLVKAWLGDLVKDTSLFFLNHSGIMTALKSSCTEMPRCLASVSRRVKVCGPKATITLTDVWVSTQQHPGYPWRFLVETFGDVRIPDYT